MDTLEEAIDKYSSELLKKTIGEGFEINIDSCENAFRAGAKWQEEQSAGKEQDSRLAASLIGADLAKPKWISVKDKLPEFGKDVLVIEDGSVKVAQYCKQFMSSRTYWTTDYGRLITHWLPIPELPKGGEE